jgi:hypothetical protein
MNLKRRRFLFLTSLGAIGTGLSWIFTRQNTESADFAESDTVIAANPPQQGLMLRFVSVGDTGTGAKGQYAVAGAMNYYHQRNPYNLVVLAGDNIYNNGEIEKIVQVFERPYAPLLKRGVKFQACLGNHDIRTDNGDPQVKYPGFNMKGRYYTFKQANAQFFALDTNPNADWKKQLSWLEQELSRSKSPWRIVFGHHQIYASGAYGRNAEFIKIFEPIFQKYGVQLYINGHEHHYERTRSINGTTYLTCGAGAGNRPVGKSEWTEYSTSNLSFATYEVYADRIELSAIGINNRIFDRAIINLKSA